jgi:hypothetical protein
MRTAMPLSASMCAAHSPGVLGAEAEKALPDAGIVQTLYRLGIQPDDGAPALEILPV